MAETKKMFGWDGKNLVEVKDKKEALTDAQIATLKKQGITELEAKK